MTNIIKGEYLDGDPSVLVFEVTEDFVTVQSFNFLSVSWLQWFLDQDLVFINTWRGNSAPPSIPYAPVLTNFKREKP